jgi:HK97 family phage portal protein
MITFSKTLVSKRAGKVSVVPTTELEFASIGTSGKYNYAEKLSTSNLSFKMMNDLYYANVWIRAIIDRIVDRTCNIQPIIKPVQSKIENDVQRKKDLPEEVLTNIETLEEWMVNPNDNNESFSALRKKSLRDILRYDAGCYEIVTGVSNSNPVIRLYAVAGDSVRINPDKKGMLNNKAYVQVDADYKEVAKWNKDEMIYFIANPQAGKIYGTSPLESLNQTILAELNASQYNSDFFANNATPRIAVKLKKMGIGQGTAAMKRFKQWWEQELEGKPHKPIIVGTEQGEIDIDKISVTNEDMEFSEYLFWLLMKIMSVYKMQPAILGISPKDSKPGDIVQQLEQFKIDAIKPQLTLFREKFNSQMIMSEKVFGMDNVYLDFDLEIGDKKIEAEVAEKYLRSGVITINEIRSQALGLTPAYWGNVPYLQNNVAPFGVGPNGPALPMKPGDEDVPNLQTDSKAFIRNYLMNSKAYSGYPVGWEDMELVDRLDILKRILRQKEREIDKVFLSFDGAE